MAKLAKSQAGGGDAGVLPPVARNPSNVSHVSTPSSQKLMPPPSRPAGPQSSNSIPTSDISTTSAKKKRRTRGKKRFGRDSFSENATTISDDTTTATSVQSPLQRPRDSFAEANVALSPILPAISQEQRPVFEKEPEMWGVYEESGDEDLTTKPHPAQQAQRHVQSYSPSLAEAGTESVEEEQDTSTNSSVAGEVPGSNHTGSLSANPAVPAPKKLSTGRFACPFSRKYRCDTTFSSVKVAKRHALKHANADKYKCQVCGKGFSRNDTYQRHSLKCKGRNISSQTLQNVSPEKVKSPIAKGVQARNSTRPNGSELQSHRKQLVEGSVPVPDPAGIAGYIGEVTSAESETEPDSNDNSRSQTSKTTTTAHDTKRDQVNGRHNGSASGDEEMRDASSGAETVDTDEEHHRRIPTTSKQAESLAHAAEASLNALKRKRTLPNPESPGRQPVSRKRARRGGDFEVPESPPHRAESQARSDFDAEVSNLNDVVPESPRTDGNSKKDAQLTYRSKLDAQPTNSKAATKKASAKKQPSPERLERRQSSLDSFVQRSERGEQSTATANSGSSSRVLVNIPSLKQGKLAPKKRQNLNYEQEDATSKGKSRGEDSSDSGSETPPDLKPLATTTARKTTKSAAKFSKNKSNPANADSDSASTESEPIKGKKKARPRESNVWTEGPKSGRTGKFSDAEVQTLLSWRDSFCVEHGLSHEDFNDMMTASMRRAPGSWTYRFIRKSDFLQQFYEQLPNRNRRSMIRFRERHFQNVTDKTWNAEDDNELLSLVQQLGTKWVEIGQMMDRTQDQVSQRYRHKLNYGHEVQTGEWSTGELQTLEEEVNAFAESKGKSPDDESLQIPWHAISLKLGNGRTPQQCSNRWRVSTTRRIGGKFVKVSPEDRIPGSVIKTPRVKSDTPRREKRKLTSKVDTDERPRKSRPKPKTPKKKATSASSKKQFKSAERIAESDEEADDESEAGPKSPSYRQVPPSDAEDDESQTGSSKTQSSQSGSEAESDNETGEDEDNQDSDVNDEEDPEANDETHDLPHSSNPSLSSQPRSARTPAVSRNPFTRLAPTHQTPASSKNLSLTQAHNNTQANSSAKRTATVSRSAVSRVPNSVGPTTTQGDEEDRPSPELSVRRRPLSSPLGGLLATQSQSQSQGTESDSESESEAANENEVKDETQNLPRDPDNGNEEESNTDNKSITSSGSSSRSSSASASGSDDSDDDDDASERKSNEPSTGMFWQSVNRIRSLVSGGSSQPGPSGQSQDGSKPRRRLIDSLGGAAVQADRDSDDSDD